MTLDQKTKPPARTPIREPCRRNWFARRLLLGPPATAGGSDL